MESQKLATSCLVFLSIIAIAVVLAYLRSLLIPFVLALFLSYVITPFIDTIQLKLKMPRVLALFLGLIVTFFVFLCLGFVIIGNLRGLLDSISSYQLKLETFFESISGFLSRVGIDISQSQFSFKSLPIFSVFKSIFSGIFSISISAALVGIFLMFLVCGSKPSDEKVGIYKDIDYMIRKYIVVKLMSSAFTGFLVWIILALFGLELSFMFGLLTFLLNFIPTVGSIIAVFIPLPVALLQFENYGVILGMILVLSVVQFVIGNIIEPKFLGQSLDLHPITLLLSLMFWGMIWGPMGMLLAAPIMAIIKIIFSMFNETKFISELMAGRFRFTKS